MRRAAELHGPFEPAGVLAVGLRAFAAHPGGVAGLLADLRGRRATALPAQPQWRADPMNVFVVIEAGDDHVSLVDGDRFEVFHRFPSRPVQGRPVFSPDGRYLYLASRDGWIAKYDLRNLTVVAEVRAGLDSSGLTMSGDGLWLMAANASPRTLALFDSDLSRRAPIP